MKIWLATVVCCGYFGWIDTEYLGPTRDRAPQAQVIEVMPFIGEQARIALADQTD